MPCQAPRLQKLKYNTNNTFKNFLVHQVLKLGSTSALQTCPGSSLAGYQRGSISWNQRRRQWSGCHSEETGRHLQAFPSSELPTDTRFLHLERELRSCFSHWLYPSEHAIFQGPCDQNLVMYLQVPKNLLHLATNTVTSKRELGGQSATWFHFFLCMKTLKLLNPGQSRSTMRLHVRVEWVNDTEGLVRN